MDAGPFLQEYDKGNLKTQETMRDILSMLETGISWANADLASSHRQLIYCQPSKLAITGEQALDLMRREVNENSWLANFPIGLVLVAALKKTFPCPPGPN